MAGIKWTQQEVQQIQKYWKSHTKELNKKGYSRKIIASKLGVTESATYKYF